MNKKTVVITSILVILATLFINIIFSDSSKVSDITFSNIDALAEGENSNKVQCIESGTICMGYDKNDLWGKHPGLQLNQGQ